MRTITDHVTIHYLFTLFLRECKQDPNHDHRLISRIRLIRRKVDEIFPDELATNIGPPELRAIRDKFESDGYLEQGERREYSRVYLNAVCKVIRRVYSWGVGEGLVAYEDFAALGHLRPLRRGKSKAPEVTNRTRQTRLLRQDEVDAVLPYLLPTYADMVRLLDLTGMRPNELCTMRWDEIDMSGEVWIYSPTSHKTAAKGHRRPIGLGPAAQDILSSYDDTDDGYVFKPVDIIREESLIRKMNRKTPLWDSHIRRNQRENRGRKIANAKPHVDPLNLGKVLKRAVEKAIEAGTLEEPWTLYLLRHKAITEVVTSAGIEYGSKFAGHSDIRTTQRYYDHSAEAIVKAIARNR